MFALCPVLLRVYKELLRHHGTTHNNIITSKLHALNYLASSRCVWISSRKRPLYVAFWVVASTWEVSLSFIYLFILRKLDLLRLLTEGGIEFQLDTLILVKDVFLSSMFWNIWQRNIALLIIADDSDVFYRFWQNYRDLSELSWRGRRTCTLNS